VPLFTSGGLGLGLVTLVLVLRSWSCLHHFFGFSFIKVLNYKWWTQNYDPQAKIRPCERHKPQFIFEYHLY